MSCTNCGLASGAPPCCHTFTAAGGVCSSCGGAAGTPACSHNFTATGSFIGGKPSPGSKKRVRSTVKVTFEGASVSIKNALVDDGYTGTICFPKKFADQLGIKKRKVAAHNVKLGDGSVVREYAYATAKNPLCWRLILKMSSQSQKSDCRALSRTCITTAQSVFLVLPH